MITLPRSTDITHACISIFYLQVVFGINPISKPILRPVVVIIQVLAPSTHHTSRTIVRVSPEFRRLPVLQEWAFSGVGDLLQGVAPNVQLAANNRLQLRRLLLGVLKRCMPRAAPGESSCAFLLH